jgi:hypothetical protein
MEKCKPLTFMYSDDNPGVGSQGIWHINVETRVGRIRTKVGGDLLQRASGHLSPTKSVGISLDHSRRTKECLEQHRKEQC